MLSYHPPPLRKGYACDRPGIFPCSFSTSTVLPLAAPVPVTMESTRATALMTSMPSVTTRIFMAGLFIICIQKYRIFRRDAWAKRLLLTDDASLEGGRIEMVDYFLVGANPELTVDFYSRDGRLLVVN